MLGTEPNPTYARRLLAVRLRAARERSGKSLDELASRLSVSLPQASRLDTGARGFKPEHVQLLAEWYDLGRSEVEELNALALEARRRAWWQQIDTPDSYRTLIGLERAALTINEYCGAVVSGLLQTADYANEVARGTDVLSDEVIERAVKLRQRRQGEVFRRRDGRPHLKVLLDEVTLARVVGSREVMALQLEHLLHELDAGQVSIRVIGFERGAHLGVTALQFILLEMQSDVPDVVYVEGQLQGQHAPGDSDAVEVVDRFRRTWGVLESQALSPEASRLRIVTYLDSLR